MDAITSVHLKHWEVRDLEVSEDDDEDDEGLLERGSPPHSLTALSSHSLSPEMSKAAANWLTSKLRNGKVALLFEHISGLKGQCHGPCFWDPYASTAEDDDEETTEESEEDVPSSLRKDAEQSSCSSSLRRLALRRFPILGLLGKLSVKTIVKDLIAGLIVAIMATPQGVSYASVAGLPFQYGMYSSSIPSITYSLVGQSPYINVGPVAMASLMTHSALEGRLSHDQCPEWYALPKQERKSRSQAELCGQAYTEAAFMMAAAVGIVQVIAWALRLGFLVSFMGHPVVAGFTSASAMIIILGQLKHFLGIRKLKHGEETVIETVLGLAEEIPHARPLPFVCGSVLLAFLLISRYVCQRISRLKRLAPLAPLVACVSATCLVAFWPTLRDDDNRGTNTGVARLGPVPAGLPPLSWQAFDASLLYHLVPEALPACLVTYLETISIARRLAIGKKQELHAGQELFALGLCNFAGSFFSCFPVAGSLSRSAVQCSSGAETPLTSVFAGGIMLVILVFLTPLLYYLPTFALAAVVVNSVIPLLGLEVAKELLHVSRHDFVLWVVACLGTLLLGPLVGIAIAVCLSLVIVIYESVRPQIDILWRVPGTSIYRSITQEQSGSFLRNILVVRIGASLYFANSSFIKETVISYVNDLEDFNRTQYIVMDMTPCITIDSTALHGLHELVEELKGRGIQVVFASVGPRLEKTMKKGDLIQFVGEQWFHPEVEQAVAYCFTTNQLKLTAGSYTKRAQTGPSGIPVSENEIGASNELHQNCTIFYVHLVRPIAGAVHNISGVFRKHNLMIVTAQVDGAYHTYHVRKVSTGGKLSQEEIAEIKAELRIPLDGLARLPTSIEGAHRPGLPSDLADAEADTGQLEEALLQAQAKVQSLQAALNHRRSTTAL